MMTRPKTIKQGWLDSLHLMVQHLKKCWVQKRLIPKRSPCTFFHLIGTLVMLYFFAGFFFILSDSRRNSNGDFLQSDTAFSQDGAYQKFVAKRNEQSPPKVILFWTPYSHNVTDYGVGFGREPFDRGHCRVNNCITTADRRMLDQSDAVVFHAPQADVADLPSRRSPNQRYVFFNYERPPGVATKCVGPKCLPAHFYNWTMTYRRDSDIYVAQPYGAIEPKYWMHRPQLPDALPPDTLPAEPSLLLNRKYPHLANRTKLVAWFNSRCPTDSRREDFVARLSKHVQVDVYGKCGLLSCLPLNSVHCEKTVLSLYKFYVAAEESLCPDYVSESFYMALMNDVVPIVYGGANYEQYAPAHSFIDIADFKSAKQLADYLLLLDQNDSLYMKYFEWKRRYAVVRSPMDGWCDLCAKLNDADEQSQVKSYENVDDWWIRRLPCYPGSSFLASRSQ